MWNQTNASTWLLSTPVPTYSKIQSYQVLMMHNVKKFGSSSTKCEYIYILFLSSPTYCSYVQHCCSWYLFTSKHKHKHANIQYHLHIHTTTVESVHPLQLPSQTPPQQLIKERSCSSSSQVCHTYPSLFHHPLLFKRATWRTMWALRGWWYDTALTESSHRGLNHTDMQIYHCLTCPKCLL